MKTSASVAYDMAEHRHRFSIWAAARAAQRGCRGCDTDTLRHALENSGIREFLKTANFHGLNEERFDKLHRQWCTSITNFLKAKRVDVRFGRAAKLVGVYLKSFAVLGGGDGAAPLARLAHPPIDRSLLELPKEKSKWRKAAWTKLTESQYYELISDLRKLLEKDEPFWKLEKCFMANKSTPRQRKG